MIDIYTEKKESKDWIVQNDLYFNLNTANEELSQNEIKLIQQVDEAKLTLDKHIETKTHNGALKMFNVEYVRVENAYFTDEDYRLIAKAEQIRSVSDYDDFYVASKEETKKQVENAQYLIDKIKAYFHYEKN